MGVQKRRRVHDAHRIDSGVFWFLADHFSILRLMNRAYRLENGNFAKDVRSWQDIDIKRIFRGWLELQRKNQSWTRRKKKATIFQRTNGFNEVLVHFENDKHKYWIPEIIAKNIPKNEGKKKAVEEKTKAEKKTINMASLDDLFLGATGARAVTKRKKKPEKHWLEIPVLRAILEEASEEEQEMICGGTRLSPLSLQVGGYYLDRQRCPAYSDMPYITMGYRAESRNYVFSCLSCCIIPPSNKFISSWLSFVVLILHIALSAISLRDFLPSLTPTLATFTFFQLFFGIAHFFCAWMYHLASNVSHSILLAWWRRSVASFTLWMASSYSYTVVIVGYCDYFPTSLMFSILLWVGALITFIPVILVESITTKESSRGISISIAFCTICFLSFLFILNHSEYLVAQFLMFGPLLCALTFMYFRIPERWFPNVSFFQFVWTSVNLWLTTRIIAVLFYHSLTHSFLQDLEKLDYKC